MKATMEMKRERGATPSAFAPPQEDAIEADWWSGKEGDKTVAAPVDETPFEKIRADEMHPDDDAWYEDYDYDYDYDVGGDGLIDIEDSYPQEAYSESAFSSPSF